MTGLFYIRGYRFNKTNNYLTISSYLTEGRNLSELYIRSVPSHRKPPQESTRQHYNTTTLQHSLDFGDGTLLSVRARIIAIGSDCETVLYQENGLDLLEQLSTMQ